MTRVLLAAALFALSAAAAAGGNAQAGKAKAGACVGCHGANGQGAGPIPALAGKSEEELLRALKDYKSGKRTNATMKNAVGQVKDADMPNLAAYFASLKKK
ncbi:MAG: c-type cytochrome [Betaproteobacteria bacterium]|nr:c-type cytochrome [Betaproteobacteria bacterium]